MSKSSLLQEASCESPGWTERLSSVVAGCAVSSLFPCVLHCGIRRVGTVLVLCFHPQRLVGLVDQRMDRLSCLVPKGRRRAGRAAAFCTMSASPLKNSLLGGRELWSPEQHGREPPVLLGGLFPPWLWGLGKIFICLITTEMASRFLTYIYE